jgi:AcrR family transcriptional regulator
MAKPVKARPYNSPRRREQAAATRRDILEAGGRLFLGNGYSATTMAEIASAAGVALKTVYLAFETKSGVLRALWNLQLRGDDDDAPVADRAWYQEVLDEPSPERKLRLNARNSRVVKLRIAGVLDVIRHAAQVDGDSAALWERIQDEFYANQRAIVDSVAKAGGLRDGLEAVEATDILWTLNHPDVWQLLVGQRGWSAERYEQWFADTACEQLLAPRRRSRKR